LTVEPSTGLVAELNPYPGYATAATEIAQVALAIGKGTAGLVLEHGLLTEAQREEPLSPNPGKTTVTASPR
jgi:aspartate ammonia-lyase